MFERSGLEMPHYLLESHVVLWEPCCSPMCLLVLFHGDGLRRQQAFLKQVAGVFHSWLGASSCAPSAYAAVEVLQHGGVRCCIQRICAGA